MQTITTCLWFTTEAEQAAEHYVEVFDDARIVEVSRHGEGGPAPAGEAILVAFELAGQQLLALNGRPDGVAFDASISLQVSCADQAEVDHYWDRLVEGGEESQCGWLTDRYGVSWQIVPTRLPELLGDPDPLRAGRAVQAMLQMRQIDIAALERAADGEPG